MRSLLYRHMRSLHRRLSAVLRLDEIAVSSLPSTAARRMRRTQIRGAIDQMRLFVTANTFFAPVLATQAWGAGVNGLVVGWTATMVIFSWWLLFRWIESYQTDGSEGDMRRFVVETRFNSGLWCLGMVLFYPFVDGDAKTILITVMTGSLALGSVGFSQAPRAAFNYLGLQTATLVLVPFVTGVMRAAPNEYLIASLALFAGLAVLGTLIERARMQMRAFVNSEALLQKSEMVDLLLKDYEEQSVEWIWKTDAQGRIVNCPSQIIELISDGKVPSAPLNMLDALAAHTERQGAKELEKVAHAFEAHEDFHDVTLPIWTIGDAGRRWIMMRGRPQFEGDTFVGFRGFFADASSRVEAQKLVEFLAESDPLTGTCNRNMVQRKLDALDPNCDTAMAFLVDLDGFKQVNDSYGHATGDGVLQEVARRIKKCAGSADIVARLGGDEFLILTDAEKKYECFEEDALSARILSELAEPILVENYDIALSASIGTATFPSDTQQGSNLLNLADLALYAAKRGGRNRVVTFVQSMQAGLQKRRIIADRLRVGVEGGAVVPYYQSQHCAQSGALIGFEVLARWTDPELGVVGPDIFIPIAEETGLIHEIGEALLRRACLEALTWSSADPMRPLRLSVNVSPLQVMRGSLVDLVKNVLEETGLPSSRLEIEVTEGVLIDDMLGTRDVLQDLSDLGVGIALDDFGTGFSSLSYLRALPLHRLKIDRSFIADLDDPEAQSVVQTIIDLCRRLDLEVVAEGVETSEHVKTLGEMKCDVLQGYYFSCPVPGSKVEDMVQDHAKPAA